MEKSQCLHQLSLPLEQACGRMGAYSIAASAVPSAVLTLHLYTVVSYLHRQIPRVENLQDNSRLGVIWNKLVTFLASNHSHLGRKKNNFTGYWVRDRIWKILKQLKTHLISWAQMGVISTQTCIEEWDTKVSHLQIRRIFQINRERFHYKGESQRRQLRIGTLFLYRHFF